MREIGAHKKVICERHGLVDIFPADEEDDCDRALLLRDKGLAISRAMEQAIPQRRCGLRLRDGLRACARPTGSKHKIN